MSTRETLPLEIHERIIDGIVEGVSRHWRYRKSLLKIRPEYLLTVSVADLLTKGFGDLHGADLDICLEKKFKAIGFELATNNVGLDQYLKLSDSLSGSNKKVDIFVGADKEFHSIELKGFDPSSPEVRKDLDRLLCMHAVNAFNNPLETAHSAFPSRTDKKAWAQKMAKKSLSGSGINWDVHSLHVETHEDPEDGLPEYYVICISLYK